VRQPFLNYLFQRPAFGLYKYSNGFHQQENLYGKSIFIDSGVPGSPLIIPRSI